MVVHVYLARHSVLPLHANFYLGLTNIVFLMPGFLLLPLGNINVLYPKGGSCCITILASQPYPTNVVPEFCAFGVRIRANTNILRRIVFLNPGFLPLRLDNINANPSTSAPAAYLFQPSNLSLPSMVQSFTLVESALRPITSCIYSL